MPQEQERKEKVEITFICLVPLYLEIIVLFAIQKKRFGVSLSYSLHTAVGVVHKQHL
jgi:hypothetical protein